MKPRSETDDQRLSLDDAATRANRFLTLFSRNRPYFPGLFEFLIRRSFVNRKKEQSTLPSGFFVGKPISYQSVHNWRRMRESRPIHRRRIGQGRNCGASQEDKDQPSRLVGAGKKNSASALVNENVNASRSNPQIINITGNTPIHLPPHRPLGNRHRTAHPSSNPATADTIMPCATSITWPLFPACTNFHGTAGTRASITTEVSGTKSCCTKKTTNEGSLLSGRANNCGLTVGTWLSYHKDNEHGSHGGVFHQ